jgi:GT2 family glycosyltransferase
MEEVTVILNGYNRPHCLKLQLESLKQSTIPPASILLWQNFPSKEIQIESAVLNSTNYVISNKNWGVWARFFFAFNATTKWICILDDDTIPGSRWIENCLNTQRTNPGLLGTVGLTFPAGSQDYTNFTRYGWAEINNIAPIEVDFVGQGWFFRKDWLEYFAKELPDFSEYSLCGEDMHFSYVLRKYASIPTYVPPHPISDKTLWGSIDGWNHGTKDALCDTPGQWPRMRTYFKELRKRGWKLISEIN